MISKLNQQNFIIFYQQKYQIKMIKLKLSKYQSNAVFWKIFYFFVYAAYGQDHHHHLMLN